MRILLVEDDRPIGAAVKDHLAADSHAVDWATDLGHASDFTMVSTYDLILLDLGLPDGSGLDLLRRLRRGGTPTPVLILSAQDQIQTRIEGLNAGADDYLTKPFDLSEMSARVAAIARRYAQRPNPVTTLGPLTVDSANRQIRRDGDPVELSAREWAVFDRLMQTPGAVVSKSQIETALYAFGSEVESNTVEVYVSRLRRKLGAEAIRTHRGIGYQISGAEG